MQNSSDYFIINSILFLAILKLLRMEILSKGLFYILLSLIVFLALIGMGIGIIGFPFLLFGSSNETLGIVIKVSIPIVVIAIYFINKKEIHDFIYEFNFKLKKGIFF